MINKSGIYSITNKANGKRYIGSAVNFRKRWNIHKCYLNKNKHHSAHLQNAWNKDGKEGFEFEIICYVENKEKLIKIEQIFLDIYQSYDGRFGYNICSNAGNQLGNKLSEETKKKISNSTKGRIPWNKGIPRTEETKEKLRQKNIGRKHTEETKRKLSEKNKGRKHTEEEKKKISKAKKGKKQNLTEEQQKRVSESHKGKIPWNKGLKGAQKHSEESKNKMSESRKGRKAWNKGVPQSEEIKEKISRAGKGNSRALGHKHTEETKKKMSEAQKGKKQSQETIDKRVATRIKNKENKD